MRPENWMKWELASREDSATRWFLSQYKDKCRAYGFFVWIVEKLYAANDHWLDRDEIFIGGFADETGWLGVEIEEAIAWLIRAKLFIEDGTKFASKKVLREMEWRGHVSNIRAEAGRKGGLNSRPSKQLLSKKKQSEAEERRGEERRLDNTKGAATRRAGLDDVLKTVSDGNLQGALRSWCNWREVEKKRPVTILALKQLLKRYEKRAPQLLVDLRYSVSNDWIGVFTEKVSTNGTQNFKSQAISKRGMNFVSMATPKVNQ